MKNILITGGGLNNKGAQAMTFICVDELSRRFPNHNIILISDSDFQRSEEEKQQYKFSFEQEGDLKCAFYKLGGLYRLLVMLRHHDMEKQKKADELYNNTDLLIDISGYALGSNWGMTESLLFLTRFVFAKAYSIKAYVMPQSFGPFGYKGIKGLIVNWMIKKFLGSAEVVYAREESGYAALTSKYKLSNIKQSCDMVLKSREVDSDMIYCSAPSFKTIDIESGSVAIIPNSQNFKYGNKDVIICLYRSIIDYLLHENKKIYLIYHAREDLKICHDIKTMYGVNKNVIILEQELSCLEFNNIIKLFDFAIASRFHSVVHSYKNGIPCLVLGWSEKYRSLMELFNQDSYMFDVREDIFKNGLMEKLKWLNKNYQEEKKIILEKMDLLQQDNLFDEIK